MVLATWWRGDVRPTLDLLSDFHVAASRDEPLIARITGLPVEQVRQRLAGGHQPYLAYTPRRRSAMGGWRSRKPRLAT